MEARTLRKIAVEISTSWKNISPHAWPYLKAMWALDSVDDYYRCDDGRSIVLYFLSNACYWRGETARRIKAELRQMLEEGR